MPLTLRSDARSTDRIGVARLLKYAFDGNDLVPLHAELLADVSDPGAAMDLSVIEQVCGNLDRGLELQRQALGTQVLYRSPGSVQPPRVRVLALAAPLDVGGNTPIEFLIIEPDIELTTLYVVPGQDIATLVPEHDVAIVVISDGDDSAPSLDQLMTVAGDWPRPLLNHPDRIKLTDRDRLYGLLQNIAGLDIPVTRRISRHDLEGVATRTVAVPEGVSFPMVARPVGSHAGKGLARLDAAEAVATYLESHTDADFFVMRYVDFSGADGQFRKYRIVFVDGRPFACHMAISDQWKIWYLNAGMAEDAGKRGEEAQFMADFDTGFGERHRAALLELAERIGLDYFSIDCAETRDGDLLVFEAGVAMVVHDMDSVELYPYKPPQMAKVFAAFAAMLNERAAVARRSVQA